MHHSSIFLSLRFWQQVHVFWHKLRPYLAPDVFSASLQLFHKLADQLRGVSFTDVGGLSFQGVANANLDWHVRVFYR